MKTEYINLLSNQFCTSWQLSKGNKYSDYRLQEFHDALIQCENWLKKVNFLSGPDARLDFYKCSLLNKFCRWINVLNSNVENSLHDEIKKCFNTVINEWIDKSEQNDYILCLSEGDYAYCFPFSTLNIEKALVKRFFNVDLKYQLIDIVLPTNLMDDIMYNVVLFHEIGHFVIRHYEFQDKIYDKLSNDVFTDPSLTNDLITQSFPYLKKTGYVETRDKSKLVSHIEEYMADLFGAQYAGEYILCNVEIFSELRRDKEDGEHPSYNMRKQMVDDFLNASSTNLLLNKIIELFKDEKHGELVIRYDDLDKKFYTNNELYPIANDRQMISLFKHSWDIYLDNTNTISPSVPVIPMVDVFSKLTKWVKDSVTNYV